MKVLVTGDRGYIGHVLVEQLLSYGHQVTGFDIDYYRETELYPITLNYPKITKDIRDVEKDDVVGFDAIVHLAGLSNDPLGELAPNLTEDINFHGTMKLAQLAIKAGVARFVYASSQSMYGVSSMDAELEEDNSEKNPITSYAATKWQAEVELKKLASDDFTVVCFRPSTVFGAAPRLRTDIVFNNLVACAYTKKRIEIKSDGTPWRPVVHVCDVCRAFMAGLHAPTSIVASQSYNVGIPDGNYTVRDLVEAAQQVVPGSELVFTGEHGTDSRTYRVSFKKILTELKDYYQPSWSLVKGGEGLVKLFKEVNFTQSCFDGRQTNRLMQINYLLSLGELSESLRSIVTMS